MVHKTVSTAWLRHEAARIREHASDSLPVWTLLGELKKYSACMDQAAILDRAAGIKSIADRRAFLRSNGVEC